MEIGNETTTRFSTPPPQCINQNSPENDSRNTGSCPQWAWQNRRCTSFNTLRCDMEMWVCLKMGEKEDTSRFFSAKKKNLKCPILAETHVFVPSNDCWISISGSTGASRMGASKPERNPGSFWVLDCLANVELLISIDFDGWFEILSDTLWSFFL